MSAGMTITFSLFGNFSLMNEFRFCNDFHKVGNEHLLLPRIVTKFFACILNFLISFEQTIKYLL